MEILIIQEYGRNPANQYFRECLSIQRSLARLGQEATTWGLGHSNFDNRPDFDKFDLIINLENYDEAGWVPCLANYKNPYKMLWCIDAHVKGLQTYLDVFKDGKYDLILQASKPYLNDDSIWFPNCYDDRLLYPPTENQKKYEIGFCGSLLNRKYLLDALTTHFNLKQDIFVIGNEMVKAIRSYWIHFNINIGNDINYRSFETLGCGTVLLTNTNPQYEELGFEHGNNCLMYKDFQELGGVINEYYGNHEKLSQIIINGTELAKLHTYDIRAAEILKIYEESK